MTGDIIFLYLIAVVSLAFAIFNGICFWIKRNGTAQTVGTIISITSPNPETAKARNSKWAKVSYKVDGRNVTSKNRVQVPMTAEIGSSVTIRYDVEQPDKLYSFSLLRILAALCITVICIIAAVFNLI